MTNLALVPPSRERPRVVVIFTAAVGGGHLAAARAITDELERAGHRAVVLDGLELMSPRLRWFQIAFYAWQLRYLPWTYEMAFRALGSPLVVRTTRELIGRLWGHRLLAAIEAAGGETVVSTFPTVTAGLGYLARTGRLAAPVTAVVTDYGVHPMWVSPDAELHLVPSEESRRQAERCGARSKVMRFPVAERFHALPSREEARRQLDLPTTAFVCLIVGGAWGVGNIEDAAVQAVAVGAFPVVVTGRNDALRERLARRFPDPSAARVLGWTDQVPLLMAAADCLVQNAGGVTCLEAIEVGLPVVFYCPIPGHGRYNAQTMAAAGDARFAPNAAAYRSLLRAAIADPSTLPPAPQPVGSAILPAIQWEPRPRPTALPRRPVRRPSVAVAAAVVLWLLLTPWTGGLVGFLLPPVVTAANPSQGTVVLAVRANDPVTAAAIETAAANEGVPIAIFVDPSAASGVHPSATAVVGLAEESYADLLAHPHRARQRARAAAAKIREATGARSIYVLPTRNGRTVLATKVFSGSVRMLDVGDAQDEGVVELDVSDLTPAIAVEELHETLDRLRAEGLQCVALPPLS